ncbi:MAG: pyruvate, phosphate dikinase, partial [Sulfolobus sp.]|nr:pyruvate, phosphate dikinase [Sulfolobus sp.]
QTRNGKLGPLAAVKVAVDMYKEGMITKEEALLRVKPEHIIQLLYPRIDPKEKTKPIAKGLPSSPGAVSGRVVFDADSAVVWAQRGEKVILVREETKPDDVHGMYASVGILTSRGGMTSHAAVVARAIGRPSVVGCEDIVVDYANRQFTVKGTNIVVKEGEWITIDGFSGNVYIGQVKTVEAEPPQEFYELLKWADEERSLGVWANADQPDDAQLAKKFGAEGIGLLRTERMFRRPDRLEIFRKAILTDDEKERRDALNQLVPMMKKDFEEMLEIMEGRPVIIRLFDPPVHEFLPNDEEIVQKLAALRARGGPENEIKELESTLKKIRRFKEANPMMGRRGVRLGITYPEIYEAQVRAILSAAAELLLQGKKVHVKIMVPQVASANELSYVRQNIIEPVAKEIEKEYNINLNFEVGTMMETVRACLTADEIAKVADFFSFGTNDLTQATFSFSRDDVENEFMPKYLDLKILPYDPFETLDEGGVARLIDIAVKAGRSVKPNLEVGICGEHGGDPKSIEIAHRIGVSYVSASPYRIPVARLAAAHAAIKAKGIKVYEY